MKGFGTFLIVCGVIAIILGVYGIIQTNGSSFDAREIDAVLSLSNVFGVSRSLSLGDRIMIFCMRNRTTLLFGGLIAGAVGAVMKSKG